MKVRREENQSGEWESRLGGEAREGRKKEGRGCELGAFCLVPTKEDKVTDNDKRADRGDDHHRPVACAHPSIEVVGVRESKQQPGPNRSTRGLV